MNIRYKTMSKKQKEYIEVVSNFKFVSKDNDVYKFVCREDEEVEMFIAYGGGDLPAITIESTKSKKRTFLSFWVLERIYEILKANI